MTAHPWSLAAAAVDETIADIGDDLILGRLALALAIGLLVGLQREFAKQGEQDLFAGARSFALIGLSGGMGALFAMEFDSVLVFAATMTIIGAVIGIGYFTSARSGSRGMTTELAAVVTFLAGALAGIGELRLATAVAVGTTALLASKPYTRSFVTHINRQDVEATVQFAVLAALVLPVLPRDPIGPAPFDAASPFKIGLMVVFILGLSFLGYVLIKIVGARRGIGLTGVLGGLVSSTAVTLTMSERSKASTGLLRALAMAILLSWTIMYARVLIEVGVVNADLISRVVLPIAIGGVFTAGWALFVSFGRRDIGGSGGDESFSNPFSLRPAVQFGLLYGVVLIGSKGLAMWLGDAGVYVGALASGIADVDAITLSMAELSRGQGELSDATAANAIVLAAASNTAVKAALVWSIAGADLRRLVVPAASGAVVAPVVTTFLM